MITAAEIRRGSWSAQLDSVLNDVANSKSKLQVLELQEETIDDLLLRLRTFCLDTTKAPVVCLDYLQIVPTSRESAKLGIDDSVRKLKKFQRETNTTFIVISSFNRTNYTQSVSFESFKESGNIEYTADVVWALQLNILNAINPSNIAESRKRIETAKKQHPRQIQLKCLKNRQGTNYDCYFNYFSAHDYFEPCNNFDEDDFIPPS
jgi:replicative DNA helicase